LSIAKCLSVSKTHRLGSSPTGLQTLEPKLSPPLTKVETFRCMRLQKSTPTPTPISFTKYPPSLPKNSNFGACSERENKISAGADVVSCSRVCARLTLRSAHQITQAEIFPRTFLGGGKQKIDYRKAGIHQICFHPKSYFFCDLKPHAKFQKPTITNSRRKVSVAEERREKNSVNSEQRAQAAPTRRNNA
jgi:hypothetical protein